MNYGFVKVASAVPHVKVADCTHNGKEITNMIFQAEKAQVELLVFPELCITGCTCGELFKQRTLLDNAKRALLAIVDETRECDVISIKERIHTLGPCDICRQNQSTQNI